MGPATPDGALCERCGEAHAPKKCQAHSKQTKKQCRQFPAKGSDKCVYHGAKSLAGAASPTWKHGQRSTLLGRASGDLAEAYESALDDPGLDSLRSEIATCEARMQQLLGRLTPNGGAQSWQAAAAALQAALSAIDSGPDQGKAALTKLGEIITSGCADQAVWGEIYAVMEQRRKLADVEGKNQERLQRTMSEEQIKALLAAIYALIVRYVIDRATRQKISDGLRLIATGGAGAQPRAASQVT